jgi:thioredoxin reductase (NADPH)
MYDLIIIGGGPAGMSAAVYAARFRMKALILTSHLGGYMMECPSIENYPGFKSINGMDLTNNMKEQIKELGVETIEEEVVEIKKPSNESEKGLENAGDFPKEKTFKVKTKSNTLFEGKSIIIALGTKRRKLEIKGEDEFLGKGVSYCATCDGAFFRDKIVAVVGGANSAAVSAIQLSEFAKEVNIIYRKDKLRADPYWVKKIEDKKNIKTHYNLNITEIRGDPMVNSISLDNGKEMKVDGIFIEIGSVPATSLAKSLKVKLAKDGCIIVDNTQKTNIDGIYAAGDITTGSNNMRQIITACAEGAVAAESCYHYSRKED